LKLTLPGNLLITGEYAILESGGQGITLAVEQRFILESEPAEEWNILSYFPQEERYWKPGEDPFLDQLMAFLEEQFPKTPPQSIILDSRALFGYDTLGQPRKLGLGSSACTAAALSALFYGLQPGSPVPLLGTDPILGDLAVQAHRAAQGKKGSGYDVLCSLGGGMGHFIGGEKPKWSPLPAPEGFFALYPGQKSVLTLGAIESWRKWTSADPSTWQDFLLENTGIVQMFQRGTWKTAFNRAKAWGIALGEQLGVNALIPLPQNQSLGILKTCQIKALGAGDEIALIYSPEPPGAGELEAIGAWPVNLAGEGLLWQ
jgi:phosphomevalonate kinase